MWIYLGEDNVSTGTIPFSESRVKPPFSDVNTRTWKKLGKDDYIWASMQTCYHRDYHETVRT